MIALRVIDCQRLRARVAALREAIIMPDGVELLFGAQKAYFKPAGYHYNAVELRIIADALDDIAKEYENAATA